MLYRSSVTVPPFVNFCQYNHSQERLRGPEEDVYAGENEAEQLEAEEEEEVRKIATRHRVGTIRAGCVK